MMGQNFQLLSLEWTSPMRRLLFTNLPKLAPLASNYDYSLKFGARLLEDVLRYRVFNSNQLILSWKYFCNLLEDNGLLQKKHVFYFIFLNTGQWRGTP